MHRLSDVELAALMRIAVRCRDEGDRAFPLEPAYAVELIAEVQAAREASAAPKPRSEARLHLAGLAMVEVMRQAQGREFANDGAPSRTIAAWVEAALAAATGEAPTADSTPPGFVPVAKVLDVVRLLRAESVRTWAAARKPKGVDGTATYEGAAHAFSASAEYVRAILPPDAVKP